MNFSSKYNKGGIFSVDTENLPYVSLQWLNENYANNVFRIKAMYINGKGIYEPQPVFVIDNVLVNIPSHCTETVEKILSDNEAIEAIKAGEVGFTIYTYISKNPKAGKNKLCYSIHFEDIQATQATITVETVNN